MIEQRACIRGTRKHNSRRQGGKNLRLWVETGEQGSPQGGPHEA